MRIRTANRNLARVCRVATRKTKLARIRERRLAMITAMEERLLAALPSMRRHFEEAGALDAAGRLLPLPIERRFYGVDLARPGSDRTVVAYGGGLGGGKAFAWLAARERMESATIEAPAHEAFFDELASVGMAVMRWPLDAGYSAELAKLTQEERRRLLIGEWNAATDDGEA